MPRQKPADKVEMLRRQQADIATKLKEAEIRAREKQRDDEQRRERLAGRCVLARLDREPNSAWSRTLCQILNESIKRPADRALFPALATGIDADSSRKTAEDGSGEAEQTMR